MLARDYAQALYEATEGGTARETGAVARAFNALLARKGHQRLVRTIAREYEKIAARGNARHTVHVTVASAHEEARAKKEVAAQDAFAGMEVVVSVDPNLIAGYRIEGSDTLLDGSAKRKLLDLYRTIIA